MIDLINFTCLYSHLARCSLRNVLIYLSSPNVHLRHLDIECTHPILVISRAYNTLKVSNEVSPRLLISSELFADGIMQISVGRKISRGLPARATFQAHFVQKYLVSRRLGRKILLYFQRGFTMGRSGSMR
jgi:hypothetical protein